MNLAQLGEMFPDADYTFSMKMRPGGLDSFFAPSPKATTLLAERGRWLDEASARYAAAVPDHRPLLEATWKLAANSSTLPLPKTPPNADDALVVQLGRRWEPDFLLVAPDISGRFVLRAGCVCFPSGWALEEKLGLPLEAIHGIVPGLNAAIGEKIQQFLGRLKPGAGWQRSNWGLSSSPERNQHPTRAVNRLTADTPPESTWVRLEHQLFTRLPEVEAVLFGIRLENVPLPALAENPRLRQGFRRTLATLSDAMASYKNLAAIRPALLKYLA